MGQSTVSPFPPPPIKQVRAREVIRLMSQSGVGAGTVLEIWTGLMSTRSGRRCQRNRMRMIRSSSSITATCRGGRYGRVDDPYPPPSGHSGAPAPRPHLGLHCDFRCDSGQEQVRPHSCISTVSTVPLDPREPAHPQDLRDGHDEQKVDPSRALRVREGARRHGRHLRWVGQEDVLE